jgi:hypothetical protein
MAGWRDIKAKSLAAVHKTFGVPAVYMTHGGGTPVSVSVRLHLKNKTSSLLQVDDWSNASSQMIPVDRIVFEAASIAGGKPKSDGFVVFSAGEIYRIGPSEPERSGYVMCEVTRLTAQEATTLIAAQDTNLPAWEGVL